MSEVNSTPWPSVVELCKYWNQTPPVHIALKQILIFLGWKSPANTFTATLNETEKKYEGDNVVSFKHLPSYLRDFAEDVQTGKIKRAG